MIRPATPDDVDAILELIRELAVYERLEHQMEATPAALREDLFGLRPACHALVATAEPGTASPGSVVGYALFFASYSTFKSRACLYLEDLYVTPHYRGSGLGRGLLAAVAAEAGRRGCPRLDWSVLEWNRVAIDFYDSLGAQVMPDWRVCRLEGEALARVAGLDANIP